LQKGIIYLSTDVAKNVNILIYFLGEGGKAEEEEEEELEVVEKKKKRDD
jgi:hypothetical protein